MAEKVIRDIVCRWVESGKLDEATAKRLLEKIRKLLLIKKSKDE